MITEMTANDVRFADSRHGPLQRGCVLYDGRCRHCRRLARVFAGVLRRRGYTLAPLQRRWVGPRLGIEPGRCPDEIKLLEPGGRVAGGVDVFAAVLDAAAWTRPVAWVLEMPAVRRLAERGYRWVAAHRYCLGGTCRVRPVRPGTGLPRRSGRGLTSLFQF